MSPGDPNWIYSTEANMTAYVFSAVAVLISLSHVFRHLFNYSMPQIQIYVVRIILICPVYAISSSLSLGLGQYGQYAEIFRDVYESIVIYSFLNLILEYCGGETDCVYQIENEPLMRMPFPLCFLKPRQRNAMFMRFCERGVLQFVVTKLVAALIDTILIAADLRDVLAWYIVETVIYNLSYTFALYCLVVFYLATRQLIKKFRPISKFAVVKGIIFATYYQSLLVMIIQDSSDQYGSATSWNNLLLCFEMVLFAFALVFAFPVKEFIGGIPDRRVLNNIKDIFTVKDVYQNVCHNFMPAYQDYALQRSENEAPETVRLRTFFAGNLNPVAIEMTERYRGRSKRFAFNALLRGSRPVRARLRRPYSSSGPVTPGSDAVLLSRSLLVVCPTEDDSVGCEAKDGVLRNPGGIGSRSDDVTASSGHSTRSSHSFKSRSLSVDDDRSLSDRCDPAVTGYNGNTNNPLHRHDECDSHDLEAFGDEEVIWMSAFTSEASSSVSVASRAERDKNLHSVSPFVLRTVFEVGNMDCSDALSPSPASSVLADSFAGNRSEAAGSPLSMVMKGEDYRDSTSSGRCYSVAPSSPAGPHCTQATCSDEDGESKSGGGEKAKQQWAGKNENERESPTSRIGAFTVDFGINSNNKTTVYGESTAEVTEAPSRAISPVTLSSDLV